MERSFTEKLSGIRKTISCLASGNALRQILNDEIYYINGADSLPPPLTQEDEAAAIKRLSDGDESARSELIEHNLRLVVYIARKFENTGINIEDLISIGTIGLIKAVNTFRADRNIKLATYASRCIENEILMYLRKNSHSHSEVSIEEPLNIDWEGNELLLGDVLGTETDSVSGSLENEMEITVLKTAVSRLSPREREIQRLIGKKGALESTISQPNRWARVKAETTEAKDPPHGAVRKG